MLATNSAKLIIGDDFDKAYSFIPDNNKTKVRYLKTDDGKDAGVYQISLNDGEKWGSPRCLKYKDGLPIPVNVNSKEKLQNAGILYDTFTEPTYAGGNETQSWLVGNINNCKILGDDYNVSGLIISTIFDPMPKYYISFERIFCENQFSQLGKNGSSIYFDMNALLSVANHSDDTKSKIQLKIDEYVADAIKDANRVYNKLATSHLTENQINKMFERLTIDSVAKTNEEAYHQQEILLYNYKKVYNADDNQNFKGSLFGFVNACTNINTRKRTNPLDLLKPVLPAQVIDQPVNFEYLCRAAIANNIAA